MTGSVVLQANRNTLLTASLALYACFATLGFCTSSIFARYPAFHQAFALDNAQWAILLFALGFGGVCAYPLQRPVFARWSSRRVLVHGGLLYSLLLLILPHAPALPVLYGLAFAIGLTMNVVNVAAQMQVLTLQRQTGRRRMGRLHAMYYVGTALAALFASLTAALALGLAAALGWAGLLSMVVLTIGAGWLADDGPPSNPVVAVSANRRDPVTLLAWLSLLGSACEGALAGWATLYLSQGLSASAGLAAAGVAVFSVAMMMGRLLSDWLVQRLGGRRLLVLGCSAGATVLLLAVLVPTLPVTLFALAVAGLGLASLFPVLFHEAGHHPADAIARVAAFGAAGSLLSPLLLGPVSSHAPLLAVLGVLATGLAGCALVARRLPDAATSAGTGGQSCG